MLGWGKYEGSRLRRAGGGVQGPANLFPTRTKALPWLLCPCRGCAALYPGEALALLRSWLAGRAGPSAADCMGALLVTGHQSPLPKAPFPIPTPLCTSSGAKGSWSSPKGDT